MPQITQLTPSALPGQPYGSFARVAVPPPAPVKVIAAPDGGRIEVFPEIAHFPQLERVRILAHISLAMQVSDSLESLAKLKLNPSLEAPKLAIHTELFMVASFQSTLAIHEKVCIEHIDYSERLDYSLPITSYVRSLDNLKPGGRRIQLVNEYLRLLGI